MTTLICRLTNDVFSAGLAGLRWLGDFSVLALCNPGIDCLARFQAATIRMVLVGRNNDEKTYCP